MFLRIRPLSDQEKSCPDHMERSYRLEGRIIAIPGGKYGELNLKFKNIFPEETTQLEVFEKAKELVDFAIDGFNSTVFAYGQTGSGKTYTLQGDYVKKDGLAQHSFTYLFQQLQALQGTCDFVISCTMVQLYYQDIDDLLKRVRGGRIQIEQDANNLVVFKGAVEVVLEDHVVDGAEQLQKIFNSGRDNRIMRATDVNETSSRSHLIFTLRIERRERNGDVKIGKLQFIDLAGSESAARIGTDPKIY